MVCYMFAELAFGFISVLERVTLQKVISLSSQQRTHIHIPAQYNIAESLLYFFCLKLTKAR